MNSAASKKILRSMPWLLMVHAACAVPAGADDWPGFRGPNRSFSADVVDLPSRWSTSDGTNIAWTADLPGRGMSGPIVVDGRVIVTCSDGPKRDQLHVVAFDSDTGVQLWMRRFWATGRTLCHPNSANAAPTPASDGKRVYAFFSSNDLICLDLDGNVQWIRGLAIDHPLAGNDVGMGSSPIVVDQAVIVQSESQAESFVEAIDSLSGATRWQIERPKRANWSTPLELSWQSGGETLPAVLLQSGNGIDIYRADNGDLLTSWDNQCNVMPSTVMDHFLLVPANGLTLLSVDPANPLEVVWQENRLGPGTASPVVHNGNVFVLGGAVLSCGNLQTKTIAWRKRLSGDFWSTPVLADNHLYCANRDGKVFVLDVLDRGKIAAENEFGEEINSTPAIADGGIFYRSHQHLWKISGEARQTAAR